jgi:hypothetical protein
MTDDGLHRQRDLGVLAEVVSAVGVAGVLTLPTVGLGFLLPQTSALQLTLFTLGGTVGAASWLAVPALWPALGRQLRSTTA